MSKVYACPHCRTQNFATPARLRKAQVVPLKCWKCGKEIKETSVDLKQRGKRGAGGRRKNIKPKR